jgi:hypothetical protein
MTPAYLAIFYAIAYGIRPSVTNQYTKKYFIPALSLKFVGAIGLGLIYQFYYGGGDTYNYFYHSGIINEAFGKSFSAGWKLLTTSGGTYDPETVAYTVRMFWYQPDSTEYLVSRIAAVFGLLCFHTYSIIALFFAIISFSGIWAMFMTFAKIRPHVYKGLAITCFFIPSMFFWGSGLLKDSLCVGALGWLLYALYKGAVQKRDMLRCVIIGTIAAYALLLIKVYILLCFLPAGLLWIFNENNQLIKNNLLRALAKPFFLVVGGAFAFYAATNLTKGDEEYDVDKIGERSKITTEAIYRSSVAQKGSGYQLGQLDGSIGSMVKLAPQAIGTSLFRPFLWEVRNPVMLLSALEATFFLFFTLRILYRTGVTRVFSIIGLTPVLSFCFLFALVFAATVGITSGNFGTLVRYKIPMIPFYLAGLYILENLAQTNLGTKADKKARQLLAKQQMR